MHLDLIKSKIDECRYADVREFTDDCQLIAQNARAYNKNFPSAIESVENLMAVGQAALEKVALKHFTRNTNLWKNWTRAHEGRRYSRSRNFAKNSY
ncbi:transcriptional regulator [Bonamia ostreae]|uniref:Transcriptional regulator n=1 Tax=Bonamia ostreae TaxID=126728 RepID=A0ABV2AK59_9EUKA